MCISIPWIIQQFVVPPLATVCELKLGKPIGTEDFWGLGFGFLGGLVFWFCLLVCLLACFLRKILAFFFAISYFRILTQRWKGNIFNGLVWLCERELLKTGV